MADRSVVPVRKFGFLPQQEAFSQAEEADVLLLPIHEPVSVPAKLLEYLATGKPILLIGLPGCEAWKLVERTGSGWCCDSADIPGLAQLLLSIVNGSAPLVHRNWDEIRRYERSTLTAAYAPLLRKSEAFASSETVI